MICSRIQTCAFRSLCIGIIAVVACIFPAEAQPNTNTRLSIGPYLQHVTPTHATIIARTNTTEQLTLHYRVVDGNNAWKQWKSLTDTQSRKIHRYRISSVNDSESNTAVDMNGATIEYHLRQGTKRITRVYTCALQRNTITAKHPLRVAVFGDSGGLTAEQFQVALQMQAWAPDLFLHTGDIAYEEGAVDQFVQTFFRPYQPLLTRSPFYGSIGNHDYATDEAGPYKTFFELPQEHSTTEEYYSFDYGDNDGRALVHFVSLNSNIALTNGSAQYRWLRYDLAASDAAWEIVYFHHPIWSSGEHGSTPTFADTLMPLFSQHGVDLVLNGHDHNYERNERVDDVLTIVTGGGGKSLYEQKNENEHSVVFESVYHFVGLRISPRQIRIQAIDTTGAVFDTFTLAQPAAPQ